MFGKLGRGGGGRGNGKRPLPPPPGPHTRPIGPGTSRVPIGSGAAGRNRGGGGGPGHGAGGQVPEETFSMVSDGVLDFGAIIRLAPNLVDEIRCAEERGGAVRIKFDANSNDPSGNVIDVDGKEFRFTWSADSGDLCDIYEERQSGEDGNGLLAECGSAWRKLNVQRVLDESIKNHVKRRSEEAERLHKSRTAIVLDPSNPSVKNQSSAAVEGSMRRMSWKSKKDIAYNKKQKVEPSQALNLSTSKFLKSGTSSNHSARGRLPTSPLQSPPEKPVGVSASPYGAGNSFKGPVNVDSVTPLASNKEETANSEKEMSDKVVTNKVVGRKVVTQPIDLRNMLINLLSENPKGMSLKTLEKSVGEMMPNATKKIESIIKNIATYQAPGRYILKPGVGTESFKRQPSESGSSPESARKNTPLAERVDKNSKEFEPQSHLNSKRDDSDTLEKTDEQKDTSDPFTIDRNVNNDGEGRACSSSESGSESESESDSSDSGSDSGTQSKSRSKSRSPAESGSESSSDSDSDGTSSSKETEVDVDIMISDDDKVGTKNKLLAPDSRLSPSPHAWGEYDGQNEQNGEDGGGDMAYNVENIEVIPIEDNVKISEKPKHGIAERIGSDEHKSSPKLSEDIMPFPSHQQDQLTDAEKRTTFPSNEKQPIAKDGFDHEQSSVAKGTTKSKHKRPSETNSLRQKMENTKKPKAISSMGYKKDPNFPGELQRLPPDISEQSQHKVSPMTGTSNVRQDGDTVYDSQKFGRSMTQGNLHTKQLIPDFQNVSNLDAQDSGRSPTDLNSRRNNFESLEKSGKIVENVSRGAKHGERVFAFLEEQDAPGIRSMPLQDQFSMPREKYHKDERDDITDFRSSNEQRLSSFHDLHYRNSGEQSRMQKDDGKTSHLHRAEVEKSVNIHGKGSILNGESSELEVGELREPITMEDMQGGKRQFEGKFHFNSSESKQNYSNNLNPDLGKGRIAAKVNLEPRRQSPSNYRRTQNSQDGFQRKMTEEVIDYVRPPQRGVTSQSQQYSRAELADSERVAHPDRLPGKVGKDETRANQWIGVGNQTTGNNKFPTDSLDANFSVQKGPKAVMESKQQQRNESKEPADRRHDVFVKDNYSVGKRLESSPEEDDSFLLKFGKDEPELRGPIKDFSQYMEYVKEFQEKHECYLALNEHLEKMRDEFLKIGSELPELSKERDTAAFQDCWKQILKFNRHHKTRYARMKKAFIVVHEELTTLKKRVNDYVADCTRE